MAAFYFVYSRIAMQNWRLSIVGTLEAARLNVTDLRSDLLIYVLRPLMYALLAATDPVRHSLFLNLLFLTLEHEVISTRTTRPPSARVGVLF
jgi:hypothetical protein